MNLRRFIGALALLCCAMQAWASDFVTERAWVEDPTGQMTLAEAQRAPETPFDNKYFTQGSVNLLSGYACTSTRP